MLRQNAGTAEQENVIEMQVDCLSAEYPSDLLFKCGRHSGSSCMLLIMQWMKHDKK